MILSQLDYIQTTFYYNLGLGVIDPKKKIKKSNIKDTSKKTNFRNSSIPETPYEKLQKSTLETLLIIEKEKQKNPIYCKQQNFIKNNAKCSSCTCNKGECSICNEKFYGYKMVYTPGGEYNRKIGVVFELVSIHIEKIRKKVQNLEVDGTFFTNGKKNKIDYFRFLNETKRQAATKFKELNYPSFIINIAFIEIFFSPIALTQNKQIVHPNFRDIANNFVGKDIKKHSNKNIENIFHFFNTKLERILIILRSQFSTKRYSGQTLHEFIQLLKQNMRHFNDTKFMEDFILNNSYIKNKNLKMFYMKPNSLLYEIYVDHLNNNNKNFKNPSNLQQVFPDSTLSGALVFKCFNLTKPEKQGLTVDEYAPSTEKQFLNSFNHKDCTTMKKLSRIIPENKLSSEGIFLLFQFAGFGIFHSYLQQNSVLNKLYMEFNLQRQFKFLELEELCHNSCGIELIQFALYHHTKENSKIHPAQNHEFEEAMEEFQETGDLKYNFYWPIGDVKKLRSNEKEFSYNELSYDSYELKITNKQIKKIEDKITEHNLNTDHLNLIALRFQELALFFKISEFSHLLKDLGDYGDSKNKDLVSKLKKNKNEEKEISKQIHLSKFKSIQSTVQKIIVDELCRFMVCEACLLAQSEWVTQYNQKKNSRRRNF